MDRVAAGGRGGRGGVHERSRRGGGDGDGDGGYAAQAADGGYAAQAADEGYAAHAAGGGRGKLASPRTRDEFKEYALAVRNRDRRGRGDEPGGSRERASGKSYREKGYAQDSRSSADERSLSRYLPGDLPPSRQRRSSGRGSPDSARHGSRGRGGTRERERPYKADDRSTDKYGRPESRNRKEPSPRTSDRGSGRGGGRGERRGGRDRDFSPPSHGSESSGRGRGGRGNPRPGGSSRSKKARYEDGGDEHEGEKDYDYERFTGAALHEGHEAFGGARRAEGPARPQQLESNHGPGGGGGGRGG
ncbi:unnamed protein product, partial [Hapterophycus canaliculatus]